MEFYRLFIACSRAKVERAGGENRKCMKNHDGSIGYTQG